MVRWRKEAKFQAWRQAQLARPHYDQCTAGENIGDNTWWCCLRAEFVARERYARSLYGYSKRPDHKRVPGPVSELRRLRRRYQQQHRGRW